MRLATLTVILALTGCIVQEQQDIATQAITGSEATDSVFWDPKTNVGADLWPADKTISSAQLMFRKAADSSTGPTFMAFVVWNGSFIGKIYRVHVGSDGAHFNQSWNNIGAQRTAGSGLPDHTYGSSGSVVSGSGKPIPHPNVDGAIHYTPADLGNVRANARTILDATTNFMNFDASAKAQ